MRQTPTFCLLLAVLWYWLTGPVALRAQTLDPSFQPTVLKTPLTPSLQLGVNALAVQPDGKVLVAGGFDFVNGTFIGKLQRLNADGSPDATFNVGGIGANGFLSAILLQPDGKILVAGGFTTFNGQVLPLVVRLNANGSLDTGFTFATAASIRQISSLALQPDGKILVGSGYSFDGTQMGGLVRLLPNGALDASFNVGTGVAQAGLISAILVQSDGNILIGGSFLNFNGQSINYLARLTASGALDPGFSGNISTGTGSGAVQALAQQADGKLLVAGFFTLLNGQAVPRIARLLLNGTTDNTFQPGTGPNGAVRSMVLDANGNILIGGAFTQVNGVNRGRVARLSSTGSLDMGYGDLVGANNTVNALALAPSGQVLVGGGFTQYNTAANCIGIARLGAGTGLLDNLFAPVLEARGTLSQAMLLANGQLLVAGIFTQFNGTNLTGTNTAVRRINANGSLDQTFTPPTPVVGSIQAVLPNGSFYTLSSGTLMRYQVSGAVDNGFTAQAFGPISGGTAPTQVSGALGLPSGQLLVFGRFTGYGSLTGLSGLIRLNTDGSPDNTFTPPSAPATRRIIQVLRQPSGKLLLYSDDLTFQNGIALVRLNANGTADNTFSVGTAAGTGAFYNVLLQPDGRVLVSGSFTSFNGQPAPYGLTRITVDGAVDPTYSGVSGSYTLRAVQPDGRTLVSSSSMATYTLVRLNTDGSLDNSFGPVATPQSIFVGDDIVQGVLVQPSDGKIVLYGSFRYIAGQARIGLACLTNIGLATRAGIAVQPLGLYPNPARASVTVQLPAAAQPRLATLLDLNGRIVRRWTVPVRQLETQLSLSAVPAGLYLLQVRGEDAIYQQKVVVNP